MCGLVGFWRFGASRLSNGELSESIEGMVASLRHRGPDSSGSWTDTLAGIAFGHRRLAIQDLSAAGHQPMVSACGRYVIVLNGEIYNHLDLRALLEKHDIFSFANADQLLSRDKAVLKVREASPRWQGHSDTETLMAAIVAWGMEETLNRCVGMFALGLWDRKTQTLTLARDRFGEKPLYYGWAGQSGTRAFVFASELKALKEYPGFKNAINREALAEYLRFTYVPAPLSIYEGISKLEPGCLVVVSHDADACKKLGQLKVDHRAWFSFGALIAESTSNLISNETRAVNELEACLAQAVRAQCISDVPLGVFLSGGVDSAAVTALMQEQSPTPIKTFTVGFDESGFDEAPDARAIAKHLGTVHTEVRITAQMVQGFIRQLPQIYDEPFADSSQIPTHFLCRAARKQVTVALSGDAGDELFGGYNRYFWGPRIWSRIRWLPFPVRKMLGQLLHSTSVSGWNALSRLTNVSRLGEKSHKLAARLKVARSAEDFYWSLVTEWSDPADLVIGFDGNRPERIHSTPKLKGPLSMMYLDTLTYLPDDILCKVDRAAMASSLETRLPFLDHRVVELAWRLPLHMKIGQGVSKWALRQVLYKRVPKGLIERPKTGFAVPVGQWLRGPLREWADALLNPSRLRSEGYLCPEPIVEVWQEHLSGHYDHTPKLWAVLMFQVWLEWQSQNNKRL